MNFINPILVLGLGGQEISSIDSALIRKLRRKIQADIELSDDGQFHMDGRAFLPTEVDRAIDELEDPEKLRIYHRIAAQPVLNQFLTTGDEKLFGDLPASPAEDTGFLNFLAPWFAPAFDRILQKAYQARDFELFRRIAKAADWIGPAGKEEAFRSLRNLLNEINNDLKIKSDEVDNWNKARDQKKADVFPQEAKTKILPEYLNLLPDDLQPLRTQAAMSLRSLAVSIYNKLDRAEPAYLLLKIASELSVDSLTKEKISSDFAFLEDAWESEVADKIDIPEAKKYKTIVANLNSLRERLNEKKVESEQVKNWVNKNINPDELNNLDAAVKPFTKKIGVALRELSISTWNASNDMDAALQIIGVALKLNGGTSLRERLLQDQKELNEIAEKNKHLLFCHWCRTRPGGSGTNVKRHIYNVTSRSYNRVSYQQLEVTIPRCNKCKQAHDSGTTWAFLSSLVGGVAGFIIGSAFDSLLGFLVLGLAGGLIFGLYKKNNLLKEAGIKGISDYKQFPLIVEKINMGWQHNQPSA